MLLSGSPCPTSWHRSWGSSTGTERQDFSMHTFLAGIVLALWSGFSFAFDA